MIQIYSPGNTDYGSNGDMTLFPESAIVHPILNGRWEVDMEHPIDDEDRWKYIEEDAVLKMPSFNGEQLFRIKKKHKTESGVTVLAEPIFMDAKDDCWLVNVRPTGKNGQEALNIMCAANSKYSGSSNIMRTSTAYYEYMNLVEAINSDEDNSFINRWGGEILFNNHKIIINDRVGADYGVQILYGKNIKKDGIEEDIDTRVVATRIYPKAYNGYKMSGTGFVDSPLINTYPTVKTRTITFSDVKMAEDEQENDRENGVIICNSQAELNTALTLRCNEQYAAGLDKPSVTLSINIVMLQNTVEYEGYKVLEAVSLGDTVHCKHSKLGIVTDARVIEMEYDAVLEKVVSVVLGDFEYNYFDDVDSAVNRIDGAIRPDGTLVAEQIKGIIDGMTTKLRAMKDIAQKQDVRAVLFEDLDPDSPTYGAMALGTAGFEIADKRTADGLDWEWTTFGTAQGFYATYLIAGFLSSRNWAENTTGFQLDLDHGTINSKNFRLDSNGVLRIYQAIIEGGRFTVNYTDSYGIPTPMFAVSEYGVGLGPGGSALSYYAGDAFMTLTNELRILTGKLTGYTADGKKGIEMNRTTLNFYSWSDTGNFVGAIGSIKKNSTGRVGLDMWCDYGDMLDLGVTLQGDPNTIYPIISIDGNNPNGPPWIKGTASGSPSFISGMAWTGDTLTRIDRLTMTIKNGLITGWSTESTYY